MIPTTGKNSKKKKKKIHKVKVTCPGWFNKELPNEACFLLATVAMITLKILPIFTAAVVRKTYSFIKIMQAVSSNYNWENGVKQIKISEENLLKSCILLYQLLRTKTLVSGSKWIKHCFQFLPLFAIYLLSECDLFNMSCLS